MNVSNKNNLKILVKPLIILLFLLILPFSSLALIQKSKTVNVIETEPLIVAFVHYARNGFDDIKNYDSIVNDSSSFIMNTFPIPDNSVFLKRNHDDFIQVTPGDTKCHLIKTLVQKTLLSSMNASKIVGVFSKSLSIEHNTVGFSCSGIEQGVIVTDKQYSYDYIEATSAHEIGHTYGLCDEYEIIEFERQNNLSRIGGCPNGDKDKNGSLDYECVDTYNISGLMGCPIQSENLIIDIFYQNQNISHLVNMYGSKKNLSSPYRRWIDNQTYSHLIKNMEGTGEVICTNEEIIVIAGNINKSFNISLGTFYVVKGGCYINESFTGEGNILKIIQKKGQDLLNAITITRLINFLILFDDGTFEEVDEMPFIFAMPYIEGSSFEFLNQSNNQSLILINSSINIPFINLISPLENTSISGVFNISYDSSDLDNDTIYHAIQISANNGDSYDTIMYDYVNQSYLIDSTQFQNGNQYKIKILATDGINTNSTESGTFTINNSINTLIDSFETIYSSSKNKIFEIILENNEAQILENLNWSIDTGEDVIFSQYLFNLSPQQKVAIFVDYNYTSFGTYEVVANITNGIMSENYAINITIDEG